MFAFAGQRRPRRRAAVGAAALVAVVVAGIASAAEPTFENGEAQPVFSANSADWINNDLFIETEVDSDFDGKRDLIHADISRVPETNTDGLKVPVVLEVSPYYAGTAGAATTNWPVDHEIGEPPTTKPPMAATARAPTATISTAHESTWVPRGFAVMHAESLGSGQSEGCPTSGGRNETLGAKAVIDWLNGRARGFTTVDRTTEVFADWDNGRAGMIGTSYNGTLPNAVATTGVLGLEAIVPISAISDWYDYYRANGMVRAPGGFQGEDLDVLADYVHSRLNRTICQPVIENIRASQDRRTGDSSPFWAERNYMLDVGNTRAAVLVAHGLNDWNVMTKNAAQFYAAIRALGLPHQIYWHQGGHGGAPPLSMTNKWFTRYLWNYPNNVEAAPRAWVVREGQSSQNPTPYAEWPDPASADATLSLVGGAPAVGNLTFREVGAATETLTDDAGQTAATLMNAASSPNRLVFKSAALTAPIRISGTPSVSLRLASSKAKANVTALLVSYPAAGGNGTIISRGWMDPENRTAINVTEPVTPGTMYRLNFDLEPKDSVVAAGRQLGIVVLSSDREHTIRPAAGTQLTLDLAESSASVPVVGGAKALAEATGVTAPGVTPTLDPATPTGDNGWYTGNVSLAWQIADNGAKVTKTGCLDQTFTADRNITRSCTAKNLVGSTGPVSVAIKRDARGPVSTVTGVASGASYVLGSVPTAGCATTDATSGVAQPAAIAVTGGPTVGSFTAACSGARDVAGNAGRVASLRYRVIYDWGGYVPATRNPPTVNSAKAGSTESVEFRIGGFHGLGILAGTPKFVLTDCATGAPTGTKVGAAAATPLRYDEASTRYVYAWKTASTLANKCGRFDLALNDGTTHPLLFRLTS